MKPPKSPPRAVSQEIIWRHSTGALKDLPNSTSLAPETLSHWRTLLRHNVGDSVRQHDVGSVSPALHRYEFEGQKPPKGYKTVNDHTYMISWGDGVRGKELPPEQRSIVLTRYTTGNSKTGRKTGQTMRLVITSDGDIKRK